MDFKFFNKKVGEILEVISDEQYRKNKEDIRNNSKLKFYDFFDDLNIRIENLKYDAAIYLCKIFKICIFLFLIMIVLILINAALRTTDIPTYQITLLVGLMLILFLPLLFFGLVIIRNRIISKFLTLSVFVIPFPLLILIYLALSNGVLNSLDIDGICKLVIASFLLGIFTYKYIQFLPLYLIETSNKQITLFLTIITMLIGIDLSSNWGIIISCYLINVVLNQYLLDRKLEKSQEEAEKQFEAIILRGSKTEYADLRMCYGYGGIKYKEKILSNESFLRLIKLTEKDDD